MQSFNILGAICLTLLLSGCATTVTKPSADVKQQFKLGQNCVQPVNLKVGEKISFSAAENPTTGYGWQLQQPLNYLTANSQYVADPVEKQIVGSGGTRTFYFTATQSGQENIQLAYVRSWAKDQPAQSWQCQVNIQP
ncbi:protease inhibitor I42 family protein [Acinetobacter qingfengensis]|uniref:Proteinase inhibitor I42 chagasin domain-containing protein n=1 Tax=Acinetobacter qingfengensis TaxID=1262585 RepID=A0A1E7R2W2_9GAMM|nr:protease inhibitor I42 family protein [Acinetobacter qingfengensis]KAA8733831.1 protease inhibitor I42 family protein [Acinetobacter qingfengensis]OEY93656.1 hypothetical protein BJI46_04225 [Acinetobacter qingfengensis]